MPQDDSAAAADIARIIRAELKHWQEIELTSGQWIIVLRALDAMNRGGM